MKRVAIPIANNRLSEFFGECERYEIFDVDHKITGRHSAAVPSGIGVEGLPGWLHKQKITDVITYKVNPKIIRIFAACKVNLYVGIVSDSPENLINEYLQGNLESDEKIIQEITGNKA